MTEAAEPAFWPSHELDLGDRTKSWHFAALICRRGHVKNSRVDGPRTDVGRCSTCGADVLTSCPACGLRLQGRRHTPRVVVATAYEPRPFCDGCGSAMPWATRQQRLYELENILDQEGIDEADRLWISEQLERLRAADGSLPEKQEKEIWGGIKRRAPGLFKGTGASLVAALVTAGVKSTLGLP
ncbi:MULTISPECIES: DUF2321 domain-containing protein [unclassified Pseudonocardia]|uniref:DUF2321 domain-containing protein n=1 Tax=unclassified Pseudonocardia TaxID=2619320 RepID=UPI00094AC6D0|nr:DUF2321 domain-containing protein [Pseudonocardia sp. Ae707_Ps1]